MSGPKLLFIGLDSADPKLIHRWAAAGHLPCLHELTTKGAWANVTVPPGFSNGCVWPSLYTGVNPGRHGRYASKTALRSSYDYTVAFDEDRHLCAEPFWISASDQGARVGVVDMVRAPFTPGINGFQIADWLTHDRRHAKIRTYPATLVSDLVQTYGADTIGPTPEAFLEHRDLMSLRDTLFERINAKADQTIEYAARFPWNLYMTVLGEPHDAGHAFWQIHDRSHPEHDTEWEARLGDPLQHVYAETDKALSRVLANVESDYKMVFAGPGMGPNYSASSILPAILDAIEQDLSKIEGKSTSRPRVSLESAMKFAVPQAIRPTLRTLMPHGVRRRRGVALKSRRSFFAIPHTGFSGAIRINLRGREPDGQVEPGRDYDQVCSTLETRLMGLLNAETGQPVVDRVVKVHDTCSGPALAQLPDLMVVWERSAPIRRVRLPGHGEFQTTASHRRGDHNSDAVVFITGPNLPIGQLTCDTRVEDIAPTIMSLLKLDPSGMDGNALQELLPSR